MRGKVAVITGATSGIGRSTAEGLARMGTSLVLIGRNKERLASIGEEIVDGTGDAPVLMSTPTPTSPPTTQRPYSKGMASVENLRK